EQEVFLFEGFQQREASISVTPLRPCVMLMVGAIGVSDLDSYNWGFYLQEKLKLKCQRRNQYTTSYERESCLKGTFRRGVKICSRKKKDKVLKESLKEFVEEDTINWPGGVPRTLSKRK
ncbi:hypothetical protein PIB30_070177, partial [Stylosanthes scabra]|nr:hypothetical protein [Stylosanthes scabra]